MFVLFGFNEKKKMIEVKKLDYVKKRMKKYIFRKKCPEYFKRIIFGLYNMWRKLFFEHVGVDLN